MSGVQIRAAAAEDQRTIHRMVIGAGLDPTALHWSHFLIAEEAGQAVGVGQIRPATPELGSLVVLPRHQKRGIGAQLIEELLARWPGEWPVYLECEAHMVAYYRRFGFEEITWREAPSPLKIKAWVGALLAPLFGLQLAVMRIGRRDYDDRQPA